ncbi:uncharacterized protein An07g04690 [Aspergillus niger]|uniref:Contig An07c0120, genomic contig n=2 Tax=Aspergillus niger TaxID=5061 RepID=A2QN78_ASPNC|nr:uncharacterized protein An07g04690 [Aspergillus niger]CAK39387.1 unnamed protein product [Aspergillus niger]
MPHSIGEKCWTRTSSHRLTTTHIHNLSGYEHVICDWVRRAAATTTSKITNKPCLASGKRKQASKPVKPFQRFCIIVPLAATKKSACRPESPELKFPLRQIEFLKRIRKVRLASQPASDQYIYSILNGGSRQASMDLHIRDDDEQRKNKKKARENPHRQDSRQSPVTSCHRFKSTLVSGLGYIPIVAHEKLKNLRGKRKRKLTNGHESQHVNLIKTYMPYVPSHAGCQAGGEEG